MTENAPIIKKELNSEIEELSTQIIKHEEDWHGGKTFKYNNILNKKII